MKNCPDGIIGNDPEGNIFLFNEAAERIFGYKAADAIGKIRASALYPPGGAREVKMFIYADGFGGHGRLHDFETKIVTSTGNLTPIRLSCELLHEGGREIGTIGFFHDISGRLALQNHVAESEAKFRILFETASDAIFSIDERGLILMANRAAKDVFEYPGQEIVGMDIRQLLGRGRKPRGRFSPGTPRARSQGSTWSLPPCRDPARRSPSTSPFPKASAAGRNSIPSSCGMCRRSRRMRRICRFLRTPTA